MCHKCIDRPDHRNCYLYLCLFFPHLLHRHINFCVLSVIQLFEEINIPTKGLGASTLSKLSSDICPYCFSCECFVLEQTSRPVVRVTVGSWPHSPCPRDPGRPWPLVHLGTFPPSKNKETPVIKGGAVLLTPLLSKLVWWMNYSFG